MLSALEPGIRCYIIIIIRQTDRQAGRHRQEDKRTDRQFIGMSHYLTIIGQFREDISFPVSVTARFPGLFPWKVRLTCMELSLMSWLSLTGCSGGEENQDTVKTILPFGILEKIIFNFLWKVQLKRSANYFETTVT